MEESGWQRACHLTDSIPGACGISKRSLGTLRAPTLRGTAGRTASNVELSPGAERMFDGKERVAASRPARNDRYARQNRTSGGPPVRPPVKPFIYMTEKDVG